MLNEFIQDLTGLGGVPVYFIATLLFLATENYAEFNHLLIGFLVSYAIVILARLIYFKERPDKQKFTNLWEKIDASSFPSLHSARAALLGTILINFFASTLITLVFIIMIFCVGISRILLKRHYFDDVFAGILLGTIVGFAMISLF